MKINENIAYSRSILNKLGITKDTDEYKDYLKIREICRNSNGYVGILTRLRFIDKIDDMDEIESIFDVLKNSNIDVNKLNKLSYDEILEMFYDEIILDKNKDDYELFYKDDEYSYYKVYTYKGILKIGSPAWCLKTKKNWDSYMGKYTDQWVIINNDYKNRLLSPETSYLSFYNNKEKPWVRFGISTKVEGNMVSWTGTNDNNINLELDHRKVTEFGVINTVFNLINNEKKSYYERFQGCKDINKEFLKITDPKRFLNRIDLKQYSLTEQISKEIMDEESESYVLFSRDYSSLPAILVLTNYSFYVFFVTNSNNADFLNKPLKISTTKERNTNRGLVKNIIIDYIKKPRDIFYSGLKLKMGLIEMSEIEKNKRFVKKVGKWLIFDRNKNYYLIVNTLEDDETVDIETRTLTRVNTSDENPICWYLNKKTLKPLLQGTKDFHTEVINYLKGKEPKVYKQIKEKTPKIGKKSKGKVKRFWDFFKK